jgi:Periplasmic binding protein
MNSRHALSTWICLVSAAGSASAALVASGCTVFDKELPPVADCVTNTECTTRAAADGSIPSVCVQQERPYCAPLLSDDCTTVTGDWKDDNALWIASLLGMTGSQAATNQPRQDAAIMAVREINALGGIPGESDTKRPLVMLSCDVAANRSRAAEHIINQLHIPAIIGPNLSGDVYALASEYAIPTKTTVLTPTGIAASIVELGNGNGLARLMVPADKQRVQVFVDQIAEVEAQLKVTRSGRPLRLAIYYRDDLTGQGTRSALSSLRFNNLSLTDNLNNGTAISVGYDPVAASVSGWKDTATANLFVLGAPPLPAFRPDIIVVIGGIESAAGFLAHLEDVWQANFPTTDKPYWIVNDPLRVGATLTKIGGGATVNDNLRLRVRGVSVTPGEGLPAYEVFQQRFTQEFRDKMYPSTAPSSSGMGPIYDAVYTVALGMAAMRSVDGNAFIRTPTGADVTRGMDKLADPSPTSVRAVITDSADLVAAFRELRAGKGIRAIGTFGALKWEASGAKGAGTLSVFCVAAPVTATVSSFKDSDISYDSGARRYLAPNTSGQFYTLLPVPPATAGDRGPPTVCAPLNKLPN